MDILEKHRDEAASAGLELVGISYKKDCREYRFILCGHIVHLSTSFVRHRQIRCQTCLTQKKPEILGNKQKKEVSASNERMRKSLSSSQRLSRLKERLENEALLAGLRLIGPGRSAHYRIYQRIECGHFSEYSVGNVKNQFVRCQSCVNKKLEIEARASGLQLLGPGTDRNLRTYRWEKCGHISEYRTNAVRIGHCVCQSCNITYWSKPSNIYVLLMTAPDSTSWVKLGFSKNLKTRCDHYGLPGNTQIQNILTCPVPTGSNAIQIEKALHKKYRGSRLDPVIMKSYHRRSGATECYPLHLLHDLTQELRMI